MIIGVFLLIRVEIIIGDYREKTFNKLFLKHSPSTKVQMPKLFN